VASVGMVERGMAVLRCDSKHAAGMAVTAP
jgi:hypothetical protein